MNCNVFGVMTDTIVLDNPQAVLSWMTLVLLLVVVVVVVATVGVIAVAVVIVVAVVVVVIKGGLDGEGGIV